MNVMESIENRRSIRRYKPDEIPAEVLNGLLESLRLAPSGKILQPRKFIVVTDTELKDQLVSASSYHMPNGKLMAQSWMNTAPAIIVACGYEKQAVVKYYRDDKVYLGTWPDLESAMQQGPVRYETCLSYDIAIALDHFSLAAFEQGLGICWIGAFNEPEVKRILSIPDNVGAPVLMTVGYPESWPKPTPRKPIEEIVSHNVYSW